MYQSLSPPRGSQALPSLTLLTLCLAGSPRASTTGGARLASSTAASRSLRPHEEPLCVENAGPVVLADGIQLPSCLGSRAQVLGGPLRLTPASKKVFCAGVKGMRV